MDYQELIYDNDCEYDDDQLEKGVSKNNTDMARTLFRKNNNVLKTDKAKGQTRHCFLYFNAHTF